MVNRGAAKKRICCSVCVVTYRRVDSLLQLLNSLETQRLTEELAMEIVIVDNDAGQSARAATEAWRAKTACPVNYIVEPEKNISLARNRAIQKAQGAYILFIDDDETASEDWIVNHYRIVQEFNADGAFGYVEPVFDASAPAWIRRRDFYFSRMENTGEPSRYTFTTNCIIKASWLKSLDIPFDPVYGISGGGDPHLFERLMQAGARFVDNREAVTFEKIPAARCTRFFILKKAAKGGWAYTRRMMEFARRGSAFKLRLMVYAAAAIVFGSFMSVVTGCKKEKQMYWLLIVWANWGKLTALFGRKILFYQ